jgi:hypothetical protein
MSDGGTADAAGRSGVSGSGGTGGTGGGTGGATSLPDGLSSMPSTKECAAETCQSAQALTVYIDPCCTPDDACGLSTAFLGLVGAHFTETCQARMQPGELDEGCPMATGLKVPAGNSEIELDPLPGCCREDGTCGVVVDEVASKIGHLKLATFGLGCIEGAPFFDGQVTPCSGAGGAGGAGGSGPIEAMAGAGGTPP